MNPSPEPSAREPLYAQIAQRLEVEIETGVLQPGQRVGSERSLSQRFNVNRQTIRGALEVLTLRGMLHKQPGVGAVVCPPRLERGASEFFHFTDRTHQQGQRPGAKVLSIETVKPSPQLQADLDLATASMVQRIRRVRTLDQVPVLLETFEISDDLVPGLRRFDLERRSFYEVLRTEFDLWVDHSDQSLEAVALNKDEGQLLGLKAGAPAMLERRRSFSRDGRPIESGTDLYRGDRVRFMTTSATIALDLVGHIRDGSLPQPLSLDGPAQTFDS